MYKIHIIQTLDPGANNCKKKKFGNKRLTGL